MGWIQKLYETYENCQSMIGAETENNKPPLLPVAHIFQQAQIEIIIDEEGNFIGANLVSKNDTGTIIPCTEESGGRSGSIPKSHPLCDKLQYIARDYAQNVEEVTPKLIEQLGKMHQEYITLLSQWCESGFCHPKVKAVFKYVQKGNVIKDLIDYGILSFETNGKLKSKNANIVVRWIVYIQNDPQMKVWKDKSVFDSWINFYSTIQKENGFCSVTGKQTHITKNHPKFIRISGDSAKLISSNDTEGFTFRGRFSTSEQACGVSYEVSQKAHNVLRWLIGKQGKVFFEGKNKEPGLAVVAWATANKIVPPDPLADSYSLLGFDKIDNESELPVSTTQGIALLLNKRITGYSVDIGDTTDVMVLCIDSATTGRMSITYYKELTGSDFLKRVNDWHKSCCWFHDYHKNDVIDCTTGEKKQIRIRFVGAPAPSDIAEVAYGNKVDEKTRKVIVDDRLRKMVVGRILPCIIDGQRIPRDLVETTVRRTSNRSSFEEWEWNKALSIACALYRKYKIDYEKEDYEMALETDRRNRDYLYGRLLALADGLEKWALKKSGENRQTTAERLMQRFADHPYSTWRTIELSLAPYKARLGAISTNLQNKISGVMAMFEHKDFTSDRRLSGEFLLGYHCQKEALRNKDIGDSKEDLENEPA